MTENVLPFRFKWVSTSPDPHKTPMRNNLEPEDIFVEIDVPVKGEYLANAEEILKEQLGAEVTKNYKNPVLTPAGMRYALEQLSLREVLEPVEDVEWEDSKEESSSDDEDWDEDPVEEADDDEDWDSDDIDWDE